MRTIDFEQFKKIVGGILNGEIPDKPIMIIPDSYRGRTELMEYTTAKVNGLEAVDDRTIDNRPAFTSKTNVPYIYCTDCPLEDRIDELSGLFEVVYLTTESFPERDYYIDAANGLYNQALDDIMDLLRRNGGNNYVPFKEGMKCVSDINADNSDEDPHIITVLGVAYLPTGLHLRVGQEIDGYKWVHYAEYMNAMPLLYRLVVDNLDSAISYKEANEM